MNGSESVRTRDTQAVFDRIASDEAEFRLLWILAVLTYGVGDIVTTLALVTYSPTVTEAIVLVRLLLAQFCAGGLVGLKLIVFAASLTVAVYATRVGDRFLYYVPPVTLALVGAFVTVYNVRLMLG